MLSSAINPLVDGGVPIQTAKSLSYDRNAGPEDRMLLQEHNFNHKRIILGGWLQEERQMERDKSEKSL